MTLRNRQIEHGFFKASVVQKIDDKNRSESVRSALTTFSSPIMLFLQSVLPSRGFVRLHDKVQIVKIIFINFEMLSTKGFKV